MTRLPRHRVSDISETGIRLRLFSPDNIRETPVNYVHQDDYYIFGFIESGTCNIRIDFKDYELAVNKTALVLPGQVHCFTHSDQLSAYLLMIDSAFVEETSQRAFEQYTLTSQLICLSPQQQTKLKSLFAILSDNQSLPSNRSQALNLHVSLAIIDIIEDAVISQQTSHRQPQRYVEHTITFRNLLKQHIGHSHSPSYYARMMNLSPMYLNEAVKSTTGFNLSQNIQNEIIIRAKRKLAYTHKSVKEIAQELGFEDYAYFTRIFSKTAGTTPTDFRKNHK